MARGLRSPVFHPPLTRLYCLDCYAYTDNAGIVSIAIGDLPGQGALKERKPRRGDGKTRLLRPDGAGRACYLEIRDPAALAEAMLTDLFPG